MIYVSNFSIMDYLNSHDFLLSRYVCIKQYSNLVVGLRWTLKRALMKSPT
jgi:hypothetical protein